MSKIGFFFDKKTIHLEEELIWLHNSFRTKQPTELNLYICRITKLKKRQKNQSKKKIDGIYNLTIGFITPLFYFTLFFQKYF